MTSPDMAATRLINAANLRDGGGAAVAVSFIYDLSLFPSQACKYSIIVSKYVDSNLRRLNCDTKVFPEYIVQSYYGLQGFQRTFLSELRRFDLVFTIFGPCYAFGYKGRHIVGFADPWIAYPNNDVYKRYGYLRRLKIKLQWFIREVFYLNSSLLVCELPHVSKALRENTLLRLRRTSIVHSAIPSIFLDSSLWRHVSIPRKTGVLNLGLISRNYFHKNLGILPALKRILFERYSQSVEIFVTFSEDEWADCSADFRKQVNNVGILTLDQCPTFYSKIDIVIFPSLLECFSAVPIEALFMKKPLVASDRSFVRDCCGEFAFYFNPTIEPASSAALSVLAAIKRLKSDPLYLERAAQHVEFFGSSKRRTKDYLNLIEHFYNEN